MKIKLFEEYISITKSNESKYYDVFEHISIALEDEFKWIRCIISKESLGVYFEWNKFYSDNTKDSPIPPYATKNYVDSIVHLAKEEAYKYLKNVNYEEKVKFSDRDLECIYLLRII